MGSLPNPPPLLCFIREHARSLICKIIICGKQEIAAPRVGLISLSRHVSPSARSELAAGHYCPSLPGARLPFLRVSKTQRDIWVFLSSCGGETLGTSVPQCLETGASHKESLSL